MMKKDYTKLSFRAQREILLNQSSKRFLPSVEMTRKIGYVILVFVLSLTQAFAFSVKHYSLDKLAREAQLVVRAKCIRMYPITEDGIEKNAYEFTIEELLKGTFNRKKITIHSLKNAQKLGLIPIIHVGDESVIFLTKTLKIKGIGQGYLKLEHDVKTRKLKTSYEDKLYSYEDLKQEIKKWLP